MSPKFWNKKRGWQGNNCYENQKTYLKIVFEDEKTSYRNRRNIKLQAETPRLFPTAERTPQMCKNEQGDLIKDGGENELKNSGKYSDVKPILRRSERIKPYVKES